MFQMPEVHLWPKTRNGERGMLVAVQGEGVYFARCPVEGMAWDLVDALEYRKYTVFASFDDIEAYYRTDKDSDVFVDDGSEG